ncbi:type IV pilus modification protein PilV [Acinetobacter thermotolerans]|uniref:type IV pilus modification protein PilV n=1 Tax=Acinetobacter thermotolerans TaxID=3151487 RepID=UPI00325B4279
MKIKNQQGVGFVEVLVALILLSIGVLGFSVLQVRAMEASLDASSRIQAMNLARDLSERMRANKSGLSKSIPVSADDVEELIDAYSKAMAGKYSISSHTPACKGASKCSSEDFAQEDANEILYRAYRAGMKVALNECPGSMSLQRYCVYVAWGETQPIDGSGDTACTNNGSLLSDSKCVVLEAY